MKKKPIGVIACDRRVTIGEFTDREEGEARRCGACATARVEACTTLIRERVVSVRGVFRSEGAAIGMLATSIVKANARERSRGRTPRDGAAFLTTEEREEALDTAHKIGEENDSAWLEFAAKVKYNAITRSTKPAPLMSSGYNLGVSFVECSLEMFDTICACNHSCEPNAAISRASNDGEVTLYSLRVIEPGEEITVCYGKPAMRWLPVRMRQKALKRSWGFDCACRKCVSELACYGDKQPSRPWDVHDPRWFHSVHDYVTGFESHFDAEGDLLVLKNGGDSAGALSSLQERFQNLNSNGNKASAGSKITRVSSASSSFSDSSDDSDISTSDEEEFDEHESTSGSEDEDVLRWHEKWRSKRLTSHSVKNRGLLTPLQLYTAMSRCRIRQDHWQLLVVRDAVIDGALHDAKNAATSESSKPHAPALNGDRLKAFKLMLNQCRSLMRMTPHTPNFAKLYATLENFYFWHALEGTNAVTMRRRKGRRRASTYDVTASPENEARLLDIHGRWEFRLNALRDGVHPDILAYNVQFNQSPVAPYWY